MAVDKKKLTLALAAAVAVLLYLTGSSTDLAADNKAQENVIYETKSGALVPCSYEELIRQAPVIVAAHVEQESEPFQIAPVNGGDPGIFHDVTVRVDQVLRGDIALNEHLSVRIEGGRSGNRVLTVQEAPELRQGDDVLLFLYQPQAGGAYNTEGDYYYVMGLWQGAFTAENGIDSAEDVSVNDSPEDSAVRYVRKDQTAVTLSSLKADLASLTPEEQKQAEDPGRIRREIVSNLQANLESGFITQEEYDRALREMDRYATIVH